MKNQQQKINSSNIVALCYVSAMDIAEVKPDYTYKWGDENLELFNDILYQFGMDTTSFIERQESVTHRTRLNRLVTADRWVGNERIDEEWIKSSYASREAKDKHSGSKLLNDIYKMKGLT
jgi:hypothetical protein